ncbi:MFS transporter [Streptomyces sp. NPDC050658]|uniref:MFS transporter n=1 Tax=unclassified Streptomyces TaxID=2593676 RepID=UPI003447F584
MRGECAPALLPDHRVPAMTAVEGPPEGAVDLDRDPSERSARRRERDFRLLWCGETVSLFGTQITLVALPLTAVLVLHASGPEMGLITAAGWLPVVVLGLIAGAWSDRRDQRRTMIVCNVCRAVLIGAIPLLAAVDLLTVPTLLVLAFVTGCFAVFFDVSYQTLVPLTVAPDRLAGANSRLEMSRSFAQLLGPTVAGFLVVQLSAAGTLTVDAASYAVSAACIFAMTTRRPSAKPSPPSRPNGVRGLRTDLAEGLHFVRRHRPIQLVIIAGAASNLFTAGLMALHVLYAARDLNLSPRVIGACLAAEGAAALIGSVLTARIIRRMGEPRTVLMGLALLTGGGFVLAATSLPWSWAGFAAAQFAFGFSSPLINVSLVTLRQRLTPEHVLGRVNSVARVGIMSSLPLGSLLAGTAAGVFSNQFALWSCAVGLAVVLATMAAPLLRVEPSE